MAGWLITGASGFLGSNLGVALAGSQHRIGVGRALPPEACFDAAQVADISDGRAMETLFARTRPEVVVHAAALSSHEACEDDPTLAHRTNVTASGCLAALASEYGARFIYISTDAVFSGARGRYRETDEPEPFSVYGLTKLLGEQTVLAEHPSALIVWTNFFGWSPSGSRSILEFFVTALRSRETVRRYSDFVVTSIYAQQLAAILCSLVQLDEAAGILHVASSDALSKYDLSQEVADVFGLDGGLVQRASAAGSHLTSRSRDLSLDSQRLSSLLGDSAPTQRKGLVAARDDEARMRTVVGG